MLFNIPIEDLVDRYSYIWNRRFSRLWLQSGVHAVDVVTNVTTSGKIKDGQFLDVHDTLAWKNAQMAVLLNLIKQGRVADGDVLFFHDLWFPGLESLFYIRNALGLKFKIAGMLHAGTWDPHDYLTRMGMKTWAHGIEAGWLHQADVIFVATQFHKDLICDEFDNMPFLRFSIRVTGFPQAWPDSLEEHGHRCEKKKRVVFPHRLAPEKNPSTFDAVVDRLRPDFPDWEFVKTKAVCLDKSSYYHMLAASAISVSCADQETWGIAMLESVVAGCVPIVPDALSYQELYPDEYRYQDKQGLEEMLRRRMHDYPFDASSLGRLRLRIADDCDRAVPEMVIAMKEEGFLL